MGASNFVLIANGATAEKAYATAVSEAFYEYGHDPYNGTISTTNGYHELPRPKGVRQQTIINAAWASFGWSDSSDPWYWDHNHNRLTKDPAKAKALAERTNAKLHKRFPNMDLKAMSNTEKWGPALCMRLKPGSYIFWGWAAE